MMRGIPTSLTTGRVVAVTLDDGSVQLDTGEGIVAGVPWVGSTPRIGQMVVSLVAGDRYLVLTPGQMAVASGEYTFSGGGGGAGGGATAIFAGEGILVVDAGGGVLISVDKAKLDQWYGGTLVEGVDPGLGIIVGGTPRRPAVAVDRTVMNTWYPDKAQTETALNALDQRVDSLIGELIFCGTYDAATGKIATLSSMAKVQFPDPVPNGFGGAVGRSFVDIPAAGWNAKCFFIVASEAEIPPTPDGIEELTGSPATHYRVGDWILSNGQGAFTTMVGGVQMAATVAPMMLHEADAWLHLTYSARSLLASSIVVDTAAAGLPANQDTVEKALGFLRQNKVDRAGDTMTGYLTLPAANPVLPDHAARKGYVDDNIHEHLRYTRSYQITGVDLNWVLTSGFYDGASLGNAPDGRWWYVEVQRHSNSDNYVQQIVRDLHDPSQQWRRLRINGNWSAWSRQDARTADDAHSVNGRVFHWADWGIPNYLWGGSDGVNQHLVWQGHFARAHHHHGYYSVFRGGKVSVPGGNGNTSGATIWFDAFSGPPHTAGTAHTTVPYTTVRGWSLQKPAGAVNHVNAYVNRTNTTATTLSVIVAGN